MRNGTFKSMVLNKTRIPNWSGHQNYSQVFWKLQKQKYLETERLSLDQIHCVVYVNRFVQVWKLILIIIKFSSGVSSLLHRQVFGRVWMCWAERRVIQALPLCSPWVLWVEDKGQPCWQGTCATPWLRYGCDPAGRYQLCSVRAVMWAFVDTQQPGSDKLNK